MSWVRVEYLGSESKSPAFHSVLDSNGLALYEDCAWISRPIDAVEKSRIVPGFLDCIDRVMLLACMSFVKIDNMLDQMLQYDSAT